MAQAPTPEPVGPLKPSSLTPVRATDTVQADSNAGSATGFACKGIRSTSDFPRDLTGLSAEEIAHHYLALRNSHAALSRSRGQLQRRSREFSETRQQFVATLRHYEERLVLIGQEKAEAMGLAEEMHRELEAFERKQDDLNSLLSDFDAVKQEAGFWSVFHLNQLIERLRDLLRGGQRTDG